MALVILGISITALYVPSDLPLRGISCHGEMVESPSANERRNDSVADSPDVAVEYPCRMVAAGMARWFTRRAVVLHAEVAVGIAKRARGAAENFMVDDFV